jgi:hypothetical protein
MRKTLFCLGMSVFALTSLFSEGALTEIRQSMQQIKCQVLPWVRPSSQGSFPHVEVEESTSANWSGYAAATSLSRPASNSVSYVAGYWTVPTLQPTPNNSFSSAWVGIDGYASSTVEQIGTEHDWVGGAQQNYVWFEMYPQGAFEIVGFPVNSGDVMAAEVRFIGRGVFELVIYNTSQGVYFIVPKSYTTSPSAKRSSAEWIVEAPYFNGVLPLADFGHINFSSCEATINGKTGTISNNRWKDDPLTMVTSRIIKAIPSVLINKGANFTVTWDHE